MDNATEHIETQESYPDLRPFDYCPFCKKQPKPEDFEPKTEGFRAYLVNYFWNNGSQPRGTDFYQLKQVADKQFNIRDKDYAHKMISNAYRTAVERTKREYQTIRKQYCATVGLDENRLEIHWAFEQKPEHFEIIIHLQKEINLFTMLLARLDKDESD